MNSHLVQIRNRSTVITDTELEAALPAFRTWLGYLKLYWNVGAVLHPLTAKETPAKGAWLFDLLDDSDVPGALGYHDVDKNGIPYARVFCRTDKQDGLSWTVTLLHELGELLVDMKCVLTAQIDASTLYGYEVGDPVEGDQFGKNIDGVLCSDFVTPNWFTGGPAPYDWAGHCTHPRQVLPDGYQSIGKASGSKIVWQQMQMRNGELVAVDDPDSRRVRQR